MRKFDTTLYVKDKSFNILKCRRVDIGYFCHTNSEVKVNGKKRE